jgi:4'-phosphopantetheinyl transferase
MEDRILASPSALGDRDIHVWAVPIRARDEIVEQFGRVLTQDELDRAHRFHFEHLQQSFVVTRGALRLLLGAYLDTPPTDIEINYASKGKPYLAPGMRMRFNVSHSGDMALYAFAKDCELGIDVEQIRPLNDLLEVASQNFCKQEVADLLSLPQDQRELSFYLCWTRKEAYIKAIGDGLSAPLDDFRVTLLPNEPARLFHMLNDVDKGREWTMLNLALGTDYAGAMVFGGGERPVKMRTLADAAELLNLARKTSST